MIYAVDSNEFYRFLSSDCKKLRIEKESFKCMQGDFAGLAKNPSDATSAHFLRICKRNVASSGQHIAGVLQHAGSQRMFLYTVGNACDGGAEFLCRGVHVSKSRSVARMMNMLRRRRLEGHPVFGGQRAGSEDGSESFSIEEPKDVAKVRKDLMCLATHVHGHSKYPVLELVAQGSQAEMMARALMDMGLESTPEAAAAKVAGMGPIPMGNERDGYKGTAAPVDAKQLARRLKKKKGQDQARSCSMCEASDLALGSKLKKCDRCDGAWYCSRECQKKHWPAHKLVCKNIRTTKGRE